MSEEITGLFILIISTFLFFFCIWKLKKTWKYSIFARYNEWMDKWRKDKK